LPSTVDSYQRAAKHYDAAYAAMGVADDAPFYLELAKLYGGPILEVGCGTGRVLLPIARSGIEIHGLDNSAPMLAVLKDKLSRERLPFERKLRFTPATCAIFAWAENFGW